MKQNIDQIRERKVFLDSVEPFSDYEFEHLLEDCRKAEASGREIDIYVVRAISQFEVFVRHWVRQIVNHSKGFAERAVPLVQNIKLDYAVLLGASQDLITFGDLVAHAIPFSSIEHVFGVFQALCDCNLSNVLPKTFNRLIYETTGVKKIYIEDYEQVCMHIAVLFSFRHQICHEGTRYIKANSVKSTECLKSLSDFVSALYWHLTELLYGKFPLTQTDMNIEAIERYRTTKTKMEEVLGQLRLKCEGNGRQLRLLNLSQTAWERFLRLQATFRHDPEGGGSIGPLLRAIEAEELTIERTKHLLRYVERKEGVL